MVPKSPSSPEQRPDRDRDLMLQVQAGSDAAFAELLKRNEGLLLAFFRRLGARSDEAEDALQETFLRLFATRARYRPTAAFRTFLFTVAQRTWIDLVRRRDRRQKREVAGGPEEMLEAPRRGVDRDDRLDLGHALDRLPEGHRMVVVLSTLGGLNYREVGEVLDIPEGTVKSRVFHALRKLRKDYRLEPTGEPAV